MSRKRSLILTSALLGAAFLCGCRMQRELPLQHLPLTLCERSEGVFRTEGEWKAFLAHASCPALPGKDAEPPPPVDFDKYVVVAAASGRVSGGAESIRISRAIRRGESQVEVVIHTSKAGEGCIGTRMLEWPTDVALIPKGDFSITLTSEVVTRSCRGR